MRSDGGVPGGILSPILFAVMALTQLLIWESQQGCCANGLYVGCALYADDLLLLSAALTSLYKMIITCELLEHCLEMKFNLAKSMALRLA